MIYFLLFICVLILFFSNIFLIYKVCRLNNIIDIYEDIIKEDNKQENFNFWLACEDNSEVLGYSDKECVNCGRLRVLKYSDGTEICEKCNYDQNKKEYVLRGEYNERIESDSV